MVSVSSPEPTTERNIVHLQERLWLVCKALSLRCQNTNKHWIGPELLATLQFHSHEEVVIIQPLVAGLSWTVSIDMEIPVPFSDTPYM